MLFDNEWYSNCIQAASFHIRTQDVVLLWPHHYHGVPHHYLHGPAHNKSMHVLFLLNTAKTFTVTISEQRQSRKSPIEQLISERLCSLNLLDNHKITSAALCLPTSANDFSFPCPVSIVIQLRWEIRFNDYGHATLLSLKDRGLTPATDPPHIVTSLVPWIRTCRLTHRTTSVFCSHEEKSPRKLLQLRVSALHKLRKYRRKMHPFTLLVSIDVFSVLYY